VAKAVWDEYIVGHLQPGTAGLLLQAAATSPSPSAVDIADTLLTRDWTQVSGEAPRSVLNALRFLRNRWAIAGGLLTVTKEDDIREAWVAAVQTNAAAQPIIATTPQSRG
jgi:hypothetical protein